MEYKGKWRTNKGGYPKKRVADLSLHVRAQYFLEPTFWEALIRELGVEGNFEVREELRTVALPLAPTAV